MFRRILNLVLPALCSLVLAEGTARAVLSVYPVFRRVRGTDESSRRLDFVQRHSRGLPITYRFDVYDSIRGWALAPNVRDLRVFRDEVLNSNSMGLRGRREYPYDRVPGKPRILVLGDSYTFGDEVSDDETFSSVLATLLPNTEVLNFGIHGYGHDQMLLYFRTEGVKYRPDVVVLGYVWFDQERNLLAFNDFAKPKYDLIADTLHLENVPVPTPDAVLDREPFRSKLVDLVMMAWVRGRDRMDPDRDRERARALTWAIFDDLVRTVRQNGGTPVFAYLPVLKEVADLREDLSDNERVLEEYCRSRRVECVFLRPRFREAIARGGDFDTRRHWSPAEHRLAAEGIRDFLLTRNLLPAPDAPPNAAETRSR